MAGKFKPYYIIFRPLWTVRKYTARKINKVKTALKLNYIEYEVVVWYDNSSYIWQIDTDIFKDLVSRS